MAANGYNVTGVDLTPAPLSQAKDKGLRTIEADFNDPGFWDRLKKFSIGGEFTISELIRLRLGYNNDIHQGLDTGTGAGFSGVSVGLGIHINSYRFDYGFSSFGDLGATHRIGLSGNI